MSSVMVRLNDLKNYDLSKIPGDILQKRPQRSNYSVEINGNIKKIVEIRKCLKESTLKLSDHLDFCGSTNDCYLTLSKRDYDRLNQKTEFL